jgi:hypothetical protein
MASYDVARNMLAGPGSGLLVEQAGGKTSDGVTGGSVLDVPILVGRCGLTLSDRH